MKMIKVSNRVYRIQSEMIVLYKNLENTNLQKIHTKLHVRKYEYK